MSFRVEKPRQSGVALFILLSSLVIIGFVVQQLFIVTGSEAFRVKNYTDRIQALYLARSNLVMARVLLTIDHNLPNLIGGRSDGPQSMYAQIPVPFPITSEMLQMVAGALAAGDSSDKDKKKSASSSVGKGLSDSDTKACGTLFEDFQGDSSATISDLNGRFDLNSLSGAAPPKYMTDILHALIAPNPDAEQRLGSRNIRVDDVTRQIRDYADSVPNEIETGAPKTNPYNAAQLKYVPKNRPYTTVDELKLIPAMDDELFDYLSQYVYAINMPSRTQPSKINLNSVSKPLFQALLLNVSNPEALADEFIKDRTEKSTKYTDQNFSQLLPGLLHIDMSNLQPVITGQADAFQIDTDVTMGQTKMRLSTIVVGKSGGKGVDQIVQMRVSP